MLIDFHSHILPGIDDGSKNIGMSRKMLEMEKKSGVGKIVLTPHFYLRTTPLETFLEKRAGAIEQFAPVADELGIDVLYGAEVLYTKSLVDKDLTKLCIGDTNYMMIELPYERLSDTFIREFRSFAGSIFPDILLILAHAERYLNFTSEDSIYQIMDCDMLVQLNCDDFRPFGKHLKFMYDLLNNDLAHLLGTDCHNTTSRPPNMEIAQKAICKKVSARCFNKLMRNAERVFSGETIL
ncbi:MAG: histidinol-phosphatase [Ruminiclostridium sp.]|nr:histidinol-phosphatase [Ruminiclostridium sp.]